MLPLLEQQDRTTLAWLSGRDQGDAHRLDERRILGSVLEPGQVAVVVVRPADISLAMVAMSASSVTIALETSKTAS